MLQQAHASRFAATTGHMRHASVVSLPAMRQLLLVQAGQRHSSSSSSSSSSRTRSDYQSGAFNFAPASSLDDIVYGCHMPGFTSPLPASVALTPAVIEPWAAFMRQQGISTVIVLLGQDELSMFTPSLLDVYSAQGFTAHHLPARAPGNFTKITTIMEQCAQQGTPVVVHCTGGCHRVGTVLTAWIKHRHRLTGDEAADVMAATATQHGVVREPPSHMVLQQYMSGAGWKHVDAQPAKWLYRCVVISIHRWSSI